jgi:hypothetical protein
VKFTLNVEGDGNVSRPITDLGEAPNRENYSDDILGTVQFGFDTVLYYILYPFKLLGQGIGIFISSFADGFSWVGQLSALVGSWFMYLPQEIRAIFMGTFLCVIIAFIIGLFRR